MRSEIKQTFKLAFPVILGQLSYILIGIVDNIMVGKLGAAHLAASSLATSFFTIPMVFGIGVSYAVSPLTAIAKGRNNIGRLKAIFNNAILVAIILGLLIFAVIYFSVPFLSLVNKDLEVVDLSGSYLNIIGFSMLPFMIFLSCKQFSEGMEIMMPALIISLSSVPLNIFLNWLLIDGNWGFPALGLDGAGWGTFYARLFMGISLYFYVLFHKRLKYLDLKYLKFRDYHRAISFRILKIGVPGGVQYILETATFSLAAIMMGWISTQALAAHQIAINLASITFMVALGISTAGAIRVGGAFGKKDYNSTRKIGYSALIISVGFMATCGLIFAIFRNYFPTLYIADPEVIAISSSLVLMVAIFQISDGIQAVAVGLLRGMEDVVVPTYLVAIAYWIIGLPIGYFFAFNLGYGAIGIWIGLSIGLTVSAILLSLRFFKFTKHKIL